MNAVTTNASLVLCPTDPSWAPENLETLVKFMQQAGVAGEPLPNHENFYENCFSVGENFLEQISFMGCSPHIKFDNTNCDEKFTFIRISTTASINALTGQHSFAPHCPHCKKAEKNWRERIKDNQLNCSHCQQTSAAWHYNWRKSAGFACCFIEITDIYPKEAIPQPSLLASLEKKFQLPWGYFFYHA